MAPRHLPWALALVVALPFGPACTDFDALTREHGRDLAVAGDDLAEPPGPDLAEASADLAPACSDRVLDGDETDIDCGGSCPACEVGFVCKVDGDCLTGRCRAGRCELQTGPPFWLPVTTTQSNGNAYTPVARSGLQASMGPDGKVWAVGGALANQSATNTVEIIDASGVVTTTTLATARVVPAVAGTFGASIAAFGGNGQTSAERWTGTQFQSWSGFNIGRPGAAMGYAGGFFYACAGSTAGSMVTSDCNKIDPSNGNLATVASLGTARWLGGMASDGRRLYMVGGADEKLKALASVEVLDTQAATPAWVVATPLPEARSYTQAVYAFDGRIYVAGGGSFDQSRIYSSVRAFAPDRNRWETAASLAAPRWAHGTAMGNDGRLYVVGGSNLLGLQTTVEAYGPVVTPAPKHGKAGTAIMVSGANFAANATVQLREGSLTGNVALTVASDANGAFAASPVTLPAAATGTQLYVASDDKSRFPVVFVITIDPP